MTSQKDGWKAGKTLLRLPWASYWWQQNHHALAAYTGSNHRENTPRVVRANLIFWKQIMAYFWLWEMEVALKVLGVTTPAGIALQNYICGWSEITSTRGFKAGSNASKTQVWDLIILEGKSETFKWSSASFRNSNSAEHQYPRSCKHWKPMLTEMSNTVIRKGASGGKPAIRNSGVQSTRTYADSSVI